MESRNSPSAGRRSAAATGSRSKYASRACQECRRRRAKPPLQCCGQKPSCTRCLNLGKVCVFTSEADNRGSAPKSYVDLLQARIKLLEQVLWMHSIDVDASVAQLHSQRTEVAAEGSAAAYSSSTVFHEMCADLEGAFYVDEPLNQHEQVSAEARFYGATSGRLEISSSQDSPSRSPGQESSSHISFQSPSSISHLNRWPEQPILTEATIIDDFVSSKVKEELIDLYFHWEQPWLQLVDEKLFRKSLQTNGRYSSPLLVCCILAVASRYSDEADARSDPDDPSTAGIVYAEAAEAMLQAEIKNPSITTVQSLGILGLYFIGIGSESVGWLYNGMANRLILDIGLNIDSRTVAGMEPLTSDEVRLRRQIYWALYCNDKLGASYTGRVCTMLDSQAAVPLPTPTSDRDTDDHEQDLIRLQRALATHCQILEKILTHLYAPKRLASGAERKAFFDSTMFTLRGWYYSLSKELKIRPNNINRDQPVLPQVYILNMVYYTSVVLLAKPFLRLGKGEAPESNEVLRAASSACHEAATEICLLGERYREVFGNFRRSPLTATHCTLTAALVIMFVRDDPAATWPQADRTKLGGCLQTLHELSISWGPPLRYWRTLTKMIIQRKSQDATTEENSAATASGDDAQVVDPNTMPSTFIDQPDQLHLGGKAEVASNDTSIESALQDPPIPNQNLWGNASTAHTFPDVGWLDIGAFDALSWDLTSQIGPDGQIWEMGSSWQSEGYQ